MTQQYKFLVIESLQTYQWIGKKSIKLQTRSNYSFTTYIANSWAMKKCEMVILISSFWYNDYLLIFIKVGVAEIVTEHACLAYYQETKKNNSWKLLSGFFIYLTQRRAKKLWNMHFILPKKLLPFSRYSNFCTSLLPSFSLCWLLLNIYRRNWLKVYPKVDIIIVHLAWKWKTNYSISSEVRNLWIV